MTNRGCTDIEYERWRSYLTKKFGGRISDNEEDHPLVACVIQLISVGQKGTSNMNYVNFVTFLMNLHAETCTVLYKGIADDDNFDPFPLHDLVSFFKYTWDEVEFKFEPKVRDNVSLKKNITVKKVRMINWWYPNNPPVRMLEMVDIDGKLDKMIPYLKTQVDDACVTYDLLLKMFQDCTCVEGDMLKSSKILNVANGFNKLLDDFKQIVNIATSLDEQLPEDVLKMYANCGYYGGVAYRLHGTQYPILSLFCFRRAYDLFRDVYSKEPLTLMLFFDQYWQTVRLDCAYVEHINFIRENMVKLASSSGPRVVAWAEDVSSNMKATRMVYIKLKHKIFVDELNKK